MENTPTTAAPHESSDQQPKQPLVDFKRGEVVKRDDATALTSPYSKEGFGENVFTDSAAYELSAHSTISFDLRDDLPQDENKIAVVANFSSENHHFAGAEYSLLDVRNTGINAPLLLVKKGEFTRESFEQAVSEQALAKEEGRETVDPIQKMRGDVKGVRPSEDFVSYGVYVADKQYDTSGFDFSGENPEGISNADFGISYNEDTGKITVGTADIGVKVRVNQEPAVEIDDETTEQKLRFLEKLRINTRRVLGLAAVKETEDE